MGRQFGTVGSGSDQERPVALPPVNEASAPPVSIAPFLDGLKFDPETRRVMGVAFEMTCAALRLADRTDLVVEIVAKRIIELAQDGERNPDRLCERALNDLRQPRL
jgi:hypothetical protein